MYVCVYIYIYICIYVYMITQRDASRAFRGSDMGMNFTAQLPTQILHADALNPKTVDPKTLKP